MMKSWADHCSSDEDTDDNYSVESEDDVQEEQLPLEETFEEKVAIQEPEPVARTYDFPSRPPFTAFVGNLSYDIQEASQLQQALADVVFDRLGERVNVLGGRISYDRNGGKRHRGFGYVELETLDELKTVMKLNDDDQAMLAGRKVQVDTANHQNNRPNNNRRGNNNNNNRGSFQQTPHEKIDGSKFRGGKFSNQNNNFRNKSKDDAPRQRPSLKLAPRSKPIDSDRSSSSDIFGGAKARDEQAWEKNRQQQAEEKKKILLKKKDDDSKKDNKSDQRQNGKGRGGKGSRGNRGGGRGDQKKGSGRRNSQTDKKQDKKQTEEKPAAKPTTKPADPAPESKPKKAEPKNKFALLMDDSDSD